MQIVAFYKKLEREGNSFVGIERRKIGNNQFCIHLPIRSLIAILGVRHERKVWKRYCENERNTQR